jgi:hypothetical protein
MQSYPAPAQAMRPGPHGGHHCATEWRAHTHTFIVLWCSKQAEGNASRSCVCMPHCQPAQRMSQALHKPAGARAQGEAAGGGRRACVRSRRTMPCGSPSTAVAAISCTMRGRTCLRTAGGTPSMHHSGASQAGRMRRASAHGALHACHRMPSHRTSRAQALLGPSCWMPVDNGESAGPGGARRARGAHQQRAAVRDALGRGLLQQQLARRAEARQQRRRDGGRQPARDLVRLLLLGLARLRGLWR